MTIYLDMDGVLADFDGHHLALFGYRPQRDADNPTWNADWKGIDAHPDFYADLPPMEDLPVLWNYVEPLRPTVLTGLPKRSVAADVDQQKRGWIRRKLGFHVPVITCLSREKSKFCKPGDILIDDWEKYRSLWEAVGGVWITHTSACDTINQLRDMYDCLRICTRC